MEDCLVFSSISYKHLRLEFLSISTDIRSALPHSFLPRVLSAASGRRVGSCLLGLVQGPLPPGASCCWKGLSLPFTWPLALHLGSSERPHRSASTSPSLLLFPLLFYLSPSSSSHTLSLLLLYCVSVCLMRLSA